MNLENIQSNLKQKRDRIIIEVNFVYNKLELEYVSVSLNRFMEI